MTDAEINYILHEQVMGGCFHQADQGGKVSCLKCGTEVDACKYSNGEHPEMDGVYVYENQEIPDFVNDLNRCFEAQAITISLVGHDRYENILWKTVGGGLANIATATARERCLAMIEVCGLQLQPLTAQAPEAV